MATEYCRSMLRICIAQLCQNLGWNATQSSPLELLTDILERYLIDLGKISHRYSEQFGRTEPNLDDLALTFRHYGIQLGELEDYIRHVEPVAFAREVVSFPARKRNNLGFPNPRSRELLQHREEHVPDHLPYMYPGMEDEVEEETSQASTLPTPQLPQESVSPMAISPTPSDKRPLSNSADGPPSKRPRLTSSNLPEEAGHSQYEMKSVLMNPSGVLTPTRQGRLPDARTPPTFRQSLQFKDDGGADGGENKEDTPSRPPFSEKSGHHDDEDNRDKSNNSSDKVAPKKKMLKHYKQMAAADAAIGMPRSPKISKLARSPKPASPLGTKSPKQKQKVKSKVKGDKKEDIGSGDSLPNESCLKDLLLSPKVNVDKVEKMRVSSPLAASPKLKPDSKEKHKEKKEKKSHKDGAEKNPRPSTEGSVKSVSAGDVSVQMIEADTSSSRLPFSIEEESSNSRDDSPERLVIAEGDTRVKSTKEAKQARLAHIDDSIDSVIRNCQAAEAEKAADTFSFSEELDMKMSPKPPKGKKKDKSKSGKDSDKARKKDKKEKSDPQSITDSIDAVIRQSSEEGESVPPPSVQPPLPVSAPVVARNTEELAPPVKSSLPVLPADSGKKGGKDKSEKKQKKKPSGKKKDGFCKDKFKLKSDKCDTSDFEKKPSVLDKFSAKQFSVYDFPESPPPAPPPPKKSTPKCGTSPKQVVPPTYPPPTPVQSPPQPPVFTPVLPPTAKDEPSSAPVSEQPPLKALKIVDLKHKQKKEKSKDKEHKKDKKDKKKDKEKKKKNKDKDKEKSRDKSKEKHKEDKDLAGSSPSGGLIAPIKLNIKFGGGASTATSMVITENKITSPKPEPALPVSPKAPRPEQQLLSPKREVPRL